MKRHEQLTDVILYLEHHIRAEKDCGTDETADQNEKEQDLPSRMKGMMVTISLLAGGAEDKLASVNIKDIVEEKQDSSSMRNGMVVTTWLLAGEAEDILVLIQT